MVNLHERKVERKNHQRERKRIGWDCGLYVSSYSSFLITEYWLLSLLIPREVLEGVPHRGSREFPWRAELVDLVWLGENWVQMEDSNIFIVNFVFQRLLCKLKCYLVYFLFTLFFSLIFQFPFQNRK